MIPKRPAKSAASSELVRMSSAARGFLVTYGLAALSFFTSSPAASGAEDKTVGDFLYTFVLGLALQGLLFVMRQLIARYERAHGLEGVVAPMAMYITELVIDAITVLLFALGTLQNIRFASEVI